MTDTRALLKVAEVEIDTPRLAHVKSLWRANRRYLGFLPEAGFVDRALKGTLLVATRDDATLGYVLYDLPRDRVKIVHLCVAREARGEGVARALIDEVSSRHQDRRGLELKCRRDFPADSLWPELGFHAVLDVPGRSTAGHLLTVWQLGHDHDDLFSLLEEDRELAVIDNNVFKDLTTSRPQGRATRNLADDWVSELIELCVTDEMWHEINRCEDPELRGQMRTHAGGFRTLTPSGSKWEDLVEVISELAPRAGVADHRHVARAVAADATYFVTRDDEILESAGALRERLRIIVIRPEMLIVTLDRLRSSGLYEPEALQATSVQAIPLEGLDQAAFVAAFLNYGAGERAKDLRDVLRPALADPYHHEVRAFRSADGEMLGTVAYRRGTDQIEVQLIRVGSSDRVGRALARQLAFLPRQVAAASAVTQVVITDPHPSGPAIRALSEEGYAEAEDGQWSCEVRRGIRDAAVVSSLATSVDVATLSAANTAAVERRLWPLKVTTGELPTFMLSIHPAWAEQLFDTNLAAATLFSRRLELGLSREHVYYRGPGWPGGLRHPARILWYVKGGARGHEIGYLRAISQLAEVVVGRPRTLHHRFARLGIWSEQQVCDAANANNTVMALRFTDTEVFERPLDLSTLHEIYQSEGETFRAPQSPQRVSERMFCLLYRRASRHGA